MVRRLYGALAAISVFTKWNSADATATVSNTFHVLNSSSGAKGHGHATCSHWAYVRPPQATVLPLLMSCAILGYGCPANTGVAFTNTMVTCVPGGQHGKNSLQLLQHSAGWNNRLP